MRRQGRRFEEENFDRDAKLAVSTKVKGLRQVRDFFREEWTNKPRKDLIPNAQALWEEFNSSPDADARMVGLTDPKDEEVMEAMSCSFCSKIVEPPALFCEDGHLICEKDLDSVPSCTFVSDGLMCAKKFLSVRPIFMEFLGENATFECAYARNGCKKGILGRERKKHEAKCQFKLARPSLPDPKPAEENAEQLYVPPESAGAGDGEEAIGASGEEAIGASEEEAIGESEEAIGASDEVIGEEAIGACGDALGRDEFPEFRFDVEDLNYILGKLRKRLSQFLWIACIPSIARKGIPLGVADREIDRLKFVMKRKEEQMKAAETDL